jgi:hypothetical protein
MQVLFVSSNGAQMTVAFNDMFIYDNNVLIYSIRKIVLYACI